MPTPLALLSPKPPSVVASAADARGGTNPPARATLRFPRVPATRRLGGDPRDDERVRDNANNETGYVIERKGGAAADFVQIATAVANSIDYQDTASLSPSTTYTYRVRATNGNGDSPEDGRVR